MAVERKSNRESGQSVLEFLLTLPLLLGLSLLLIRVNTTIQMAIVDQQFARMQTFFITANSSVYPRLDLQSKMATKGNNQMVLGVSFNPAPGGDQDEDGGDYSPEPPTNKINGRNGGGSEAQGEVSQRSDVRVRSTVTLCTQQISAGTSALLPFGTSGGGFVATGPSILSENMTFDFCSSAEEYAP